MRKFLSIIIPRYKETEQSMMTLLSSINNQIKIDMDDIEVIIVNDGTDYLNEEFCNLFQYKISQMLLSTNSGPGVARQAGIDISAGEFIMFCDADDILYSNDILTIFFNKIDRCNDYPDMVISSWLEETERDLLIHENENTWLFGKLFRKKFLEKNNIKFHPDLRVHEDSYFLALCRALTKNIIVVKNFSYIWKYTKSSITRANDKEYSYVSIPEYIKTFSLASEIIEQKNPNDMPHRVTQFLMYIFFNSHQPNWQDESKKEYLNAVEEAILQYLPRYMKWFTNQAIETIRWEYNEERKRTFSDFIETETFESWLKRLNLLEDFQNER